MSSTQHSEVKLGFRHRGPIRWKGFIPIVVLLSGTIIYFTFFFDPTLKYLFQKFGTMARGARVDIAYLRTSFLNSSFELRKLELASPTEAMRNVVEIGEIRFQFLFSALFRKKVVIDEMKMESIRYGTPRTYSGLVPPAPKSTGPTFFSKTTDKLTALVEEKVKESPLNELGTLLGKNDLVSQVKNLGEATHALAKIREIEKQVSEAESQWKTLLGQLPNEAKIKEFQNRVSKITQTPHQSPQDLANAAQEVTSVKKEIETSLDQVNRAQSTVQTQVTQLNSGVSSIDSAVQQDISDFGKKLKLPELNIKDLSPQLLGPKIIPQFNRLLYYVELARKYMPKKKAKSNVVVQKRKRGTDILFGKINSYPGFWVKHASITSDISSDAHAGKVSGEILHFNTNPPMVGKPTVFQLKGVFPKSHIEGAQIRVSIDHTSEAATEDFLLQVARFPIQDLSFTKTSDLQFGIQQSYGAFQTSVHFAEETFLGELKARLNDIQYDLKSSNSEIENILRRVLNSLNQVNAEATLKGSAQGVDFHASSDLGVRLIDGLKKEFQRQLAQIQETLKKKVNEEIAAQKQKLVTELTRVKDSTLGPLAKNINSIKDAQNFANQQLQKLQNEQKQKVEGEAKKHLNELKKNIKIPGF